MRDILVFDVDGTLTPPRAKMEDAMARVFRRLAARQPVYLVTGSDMTKLRQQVADDIIASVAGVFACSGSEWWRGGRLLRAMHHSFPDDLPAFALELVERSSYALRTGKHVEERTGALNISVVGRNANSLQRRDYARHDEATGERRALAAAIEARFPEYEASCGGQISVDVTPRGWNKGRIVRDIRSEQGGAPIAFFGDRICEGGNDLPLAKALGMESEHNRLFPVADHRETLSILRARFLDPVARDAVA